MPDWLAGLFETGTIALVAVAVLIVETGVLMALRHRSGLGARTLVFNSVSGIALLLALWGALSEPSNTVWIAACLTVGFAGHLGDVRARWRRGA